MKQLVAKAGEDNYTSWSVLGVDVCRRAWMSIHCMGRFDVIFFCVLEAPLVVGARGSAMGVVMEFTLTAFV